MASRYNGIEKVVLKKLMHLNAMIVGIILGLFLGLGIFLATIILLIRGGNNIGPHLSLLGQFFIGYQVSFLGSIIGLLYGFILGFSAGYVFALLYNWMTNLRQSIKTPR